MPWSFILGSLNAGIGVGPEVLHSAETSMNRVCESARQVGDPLGQPAPCLRFPSRLQMLVAGLC